MKLLVSAFALSQIFCTLIEASAGRSLGEEVYPGSSLPPREHMLRRGGNSSPDWSKRGHSVNARMVRKHKRRAGGAAAAAAAGMGSMPAMGLTVRMVGKAAPNTEGKRRLKREWSENVVRKFRRGPSAIGPDQDFQASQTSQDPTSGSTTIPENATPTTSDAAATLAPSSSVVSDNEMSSNTWNHHRTHTWSEGGDSESATSTASSEGASPSSGSSSDASGSSSSDNSSSSNTDSSSTDSSSSADSNSSDTSESSSTDTSSSGTTDDPDSCEADEGDGADDDGDDGDDDGDDDDCDDDDDDETEVTASVSASASAASASSGTISGQTFTGTATWYTQNGVAGACGTVAQDSDHVVALFTSDYDSGSNCGRQVMLTNTDTGASTTATVRDECPTCVSSGNIDLSVGTFTSLGDQSQGVLNVQWGYIS